MKQQKCCGELHFDLEPKLAVPIQKLSRVAKSNLLFRYSPASKTKTPCGDPSFNLLPTKSLVLDTNFTHLSLLV